MNYETWHRIMRQTHRPDYYPISYLTRDHYGVLFPIGPIRLKNGETLQMRDVPGFRKTYRKGLPTERIVYRVVRGDGRSEDLPDHLQPTLFRPANPKRYPDPLPLPASLTSEVNWRSQHPPKAIEEPVSDLDWPAVAYGLPPDISLEEVEIRVLRAWKTQRVNDVEGAGLGGPKGFKTGAVYGIDRVAPTTGWEPTKLDLGDWDRALGWCTKLRDPVNQKLIEMRSLDYSYRRISEMLKLGVSDETVRRWYRRALEALTKIANRPGAK